MGARSRGGGSMRRRERGGKKGRRGRGGARGVKVWGKGRKAREGHEETSWEVVCSEDVQLEVRVLHDLHREVISPSNSLLQDIVQLG